MSYIELNSSNFFHNLNLISKKINGIEKLFVVLKDNAYGHGIEEMAKLSKRAGVNKCAVKNINEALKIKEFFSYTLVLSDIPNTKINDIGIAINDIKSITKIPKGSKVELKVDTGMHRNGVSLEDIQKAIKLIKQNRLDMVGVYSHFRSADVLSSEYFWQKENFKKVKQITKETCQKLHLKLPYFHSHNSAAIFRDNNFDDDFARSGSNIYGYHYLPPPLANPPLRPVLSLWANKLNTRKLKKGQRVGYGGVFEAKKDMIVSTYDIGYGDGFFRYDGLGNLKIANGKQILGRVSMDSMSIEGNDEKICIFEDATYLSEQFNTITYEIMTNLSHLIKRVII